jgi:hypothetical protein
MNQNVSDSLMGCFYLSMALWESMGAVMRNDDFN